jgi:hypothetical protein
MDCGSSSTIAFLSTGSGFIELEFLVSGKEASRDPSGHLFQVQTKFQIAVF